MRTDRQALFDFLVGGRPGGGPDIRVRLAALDPFFRKAEAGEYDLTPAERVRPQDVTDAIFSATGTAIRRVAFVSLSAGASPLVGEARAAFWEAHARGLSDDLKHALWRRHGDFLGHAFAGVRRSRLERVIWHAIGEPLWHSFERNRWDETGNDLRLVVRANVLGAVLSFAGSAMIGDPERVELLRPLIVLLADVLPIGERADEPGTWTCITA